MNGTEKVVVTLVLSGFLSGLVFFAFDDMVEGDDSQWQRPHFEPLAQSLEGNEILYLLLAGTSVLDMFRK